MGEDARERVGTGRAVLTRRKALSPCSVKGCPTLTWSNRCDEHQREAEAKRGSSVERGYDTAWRRTRAAYLKAHPYCQDHGGCIAPATDVHHLDGLGPKGPQGHDWQNLQGLCHAHHSRITAREVGGWNVRPD